MGKRSVWLIALVIVLVCVIVLFAISWKMSQTQESRCSVDGRLIAANTTFGFEMLKELARRDPAHNLFISPASVALSLSMTYNGADGSTKAAIARVLGIQGLSLADLNSANAALLSNLQGPGPGVTITVANSLWVCEGVRFHQGFLDGDRRFYGVDITSLDFRAPDARERINRWVSDKTAGRINSLIDRIDPADVLLLVNAIHFKGEWTDKFDKRNTQPRLFKLQNGKRVHVPMMTREGTLNIYRGKKFTAVALPYGKGRVSFYVFLPDEDSSLEAFYKELTADNWQTWISGLRELHGAHITMPRFKIEYGISLTNTLLALGMGPAFDPNQADFSNMCEDKVWIRDVVHKSILEVNEEGTEAAAATNTFMTSGVSLEGIVVVDRPFVCAIRDNKTGEILFLGAIVDLR